MKANKAELRAARRIANAVRAAINAITDAYTEANDHEQVIIRFAQVMAEERGRK